MDVSYDEEKRARILAERELDIADAAIAFDQFHLTRRDERHSEEEERFISVGQIGDDVVIIIWTPREDSRRIVTMWKANDKERQAYRRQRDRPG